VDGGRLLHQRRVHDQPVTIGISIVSTVIAIVLMDKVNRGPVMWLMLGELFDSRLRTTAVAVCTAANWLTNWAVTRTFPLLAGTGLGLAYGLYAAFVVLAPCSSSSCFRRRGGALCPRRGRAASWRVR
jgi:hypothetical protein